MNVELSEDEAYLAYSDWSECYCAASWLYLPESDIDLYIIMKTALFDLIEKYMKID